MPMKPHKGESQDDFMARCMHEVYGPDAPADRTQEQAVAICFGYWREEHGGKPPSKGEVADWVAKFKQVYAKAAKQVEDLTSDDCPAPEDGETKEEYLDRCYDDMIDQASHGGSEELDPSAGGEIYALCEEAWEDVKGEASYVAHQRQRNKPGVTLFRTHSEPAIGGYFVLSDESVDRLGEILTAGGWNLDNFRKNPIALFNHRSDFVIGRWHDLAIKEGKLKGRLELARAGTSERIDEIRALVDAGILRAVSVGFQAKKKEPMDDKSDPYFGPFRYLAQELVECSLVSVPANPNALAVAKSLNISPATIDAVFARSGKGGRTQRRGLHGGFARRNGQQRRANMSSLAQRIVEVQNQIGGKREALAAHLEKMDDTNVSDADLETTATLNAEIDQLEKTRSVLVASEKNLATQADNKGARLPAVIIPGGNSSTVSPTSGRATTVEAPMIGFNVKKEPDLLDYICRAGTIALHARNWNKGFEETLVKIYGDDETTRFVLDLVTRAASAPAMTSVPGWAQELVQQVWTSLMPTLMPKAILTRLATRGLSLSFGRFGKINIPTRSRTPSLAGSFVGEGLAIPVRQGAFTTQALVPKKMAVISTFTREMEDHSIPAIEGIIRDAIQTDTSVAVDSVLLDANPATTIRPAGLLNGVAALTATAGGGLPAIIGDIKALIGALTTALYGNVRDPVWLMNPTDVLGAGLVSAVNTGIFPFKEEIAAGRLANIPIIDSATVPAKTMVIVDAADFVVADGGAPRIDMSDQATLHMEDTTPADLVGPGSPGAVASPQRSLFQTDSIALRMVMPLNWLNRRPGTVAWVQNVTWS